VGKCIGPWIKGILPGGIPFSKAKKKKTRIGRKFALRDAKAHLVGQVTSETGNNLQRYERKNLQPLLKKNKKKKKTKKAGSTLNGRRGRGRPAKTLS